MHGATVKISEMS